MPKENRDAERVVGPNARTPGCNDAICYLLFWAMAIMIVVFFFIWTGEGAEGFPSDSLEQLAFDANGTVSELGSASALSAFYALLFSIIWVFLYMGALRVAAYQLIVGINVLMIILWLTFGGVALGYAATCQDFTGPKNAIPPTSETPCVDLYESSYWSSLIIGIVLLACGVLHALWLCCIRKRIEITARILSAVSMVLSECPGVIVIGLIMAVIGVVWYGFWYGAFLQMSNYLADGGATTTSGGIVVPSMDASYWGSWVGMLFGMLICLFWGHKVVGNVAHMTAAHVVAEWYFDPASKGEGLPCCRPTTCTGLKRSLINYFGSIAFGSLIVAILEAIYYTLKVVLSQATKGSNMIVKMIACCVLCCVNCLKNTIEWLTEWAFVYIAVYGDGFVSAGGRVAKMLFESGMGAIAQSTLVYPVLNVGKLIGAAAGVGAGFLTLESFTSLQDEWLQPLLGGLVGFAVASVGFACLDAGNKSMFVCYIEAPDLMKERCPGLNDVFSGDERNKVAEYSGGAAKAGEVQVEVVRP